MKAHIGIGIGYLRERVHELGDKQRLIEQGGVPLHTDAALAWLEEQEQAGKRMISVGCPTPKPDGSCPGHSV